jgi:hypothetical protein
VAAGDDGTVGEADVDRLARAEGDRAHAHPDALGIGGDGGDE